MLKYCGIIMGIAMSIICGAFAIICLVHNLWGLSIIAIVFTFASMAMLSIEISENKEDK